MFLSGKDRSESRPKSEEQEKLEVAVEVQKQEVTTTEDVKPTDGEPAPESPPPSEQQDGQDSELEPGETNWRWINPNTQVSALYVMSLLLSLHNVLL